MFRDRIDLNVSTNISGELIVDNLTTTSISTNSLSCSNICSINVSITTLDVGSLTATNFYLGSTTTLVVGATRIGTNAAYTTFASFGSASLANNSQYYCIGQDILDGEVLSIRRGSLG